MRLPFPHLPPVPGWAAAWALWLLVATAAVAGVPTGPSPPPASGSAALASIESTVRGRGAALLPVDSPAQIERLAAEGHFRAQMADAEGSERIARQIEMTRTDGLGQAAAGYVRGQWLARHGSLSRADRRFGEAPRLSQQAIAMADASGIAWRRADERSAMAYTLSQVDQVDRGLALNAEAQRIATAAGALLAMSVAFTVRSLPGLLDPGARRAGGLQRQLSAGGRRPLQAHQRSPRPCRWRSHAGRRGAPASGRGARRRPRGALGRPVKLEEAINLADQALYTAKNQGRNRAVGIDAVRARDAAVDTAELSPAR